MPSAADAIPKGTITPDAIFREAMLARRRLAGIEPPTPIERIDLPNGGAALVKREDRSRVNSFKWRGATNRIAAMREQGETGPAVAASAGNHAQGVALAAARHGVNAVIVMPRSTPAIKRERVAELGGDLVRVELIGDSYDEASDAARVIAGDCDGVWVHPFDDPLVIAGQGVIGDEIVQQLDDAPRAIYLCVGGGGLAAGVAAVIRAHWPSVELIGVEAEGQASMAAAIEAGAPVDIGPVDRFCDGTAVRLAGANTHALCAALLDRVITVTNDQVCAAIETAWRTMRAIPEPSGALGLAGMLNDPSPRNTDARDPLVILSGSNVDFMTLPRIARRAHYGARVRRRLAFRIDERAGSLVELLELIGDGCNIAEFQYGKTHETDAEPVIGFEASPERLDALESRLAGSRIPFRDVSDRLAIDHRVIPMRPELFRDPLFACITFPDRGGALREFLHAAGEHASICYFNFATTGETEGRALMGFDFERPDDRAAFRDRLANCGLRVEELAGEGCPLAAITTTTKETTDSNATTQEESK